MKTMTTNETMSINGGATYSCPFGCNVKGGYWSVYWHCLSSGCFKRNKYLNGLWTAGWGLINIGKKLSGFIK